MVPRKPLTPNKQVVTKAFAEEATSVLGVQLTRYLKQKSKETPSIKNWSSPGKGVQGESVNSSNKRFTNLRGRGQ